MSSRKWPGVSVISHEPEVARTFVPMLKPSRYKAAYGGRGSGKSQFFADLMIGYALKKPGFRGLCCREIQKSLKESAKQLIATKITAHKLGKQFDVQDAQIKTPGGGVIAFAGLQDHTAESIKSYEGFDVAWVEEAQTITANSLKLLRPTIRAAGSELWFSWNPRRRIDPVDAMFRSKTPPTNSIIVKANYTENPWFPPELEQERLDCERDDPDDYDHIWEGGYVTVAKGAYFSTQLNKARKEGRIAPLVAEDPNLIVRIYADLGGTGAKADNFVFWAAQHVGTEIRWINHYEVKGQPVSAHLNWLREQGYTESRTLIVLPHDGDTQDRVYDTSFRTAFEGAGYDVTVIPNQGKGAAKLRIEAARRLFNRMRFDEPKCDAGLQALGWYHEKQDEKRDVGLGADHDWASHSADAFGLGCVAYEEPSIPAPPPVNPQLQGEAAWMGGWA